MMMLLRRCRCRCWLSRLDCHCACLAHPSFAACYVQVLVKALLKQACQPLTSGDTKEVEDCAGVLRVEKNKAEQAAKQKAGESGAYAQ